MEKINRHIAAFTLVELSIVLVIIGLIIGSILVGQSLIKQATLRSVASEFQNYYSAITRFQHTYNWLPGDMPNATSVWSGTSNGSGNGEIDNAESYLAWQHLSLAQLVRGTYSGTAGAVIGTNVPTSAMANASYLPQWYNAPSWLYNEPSGNYMIFGIMTSNWWTNEQSSLLPGDAATIDTKIDDGQIASGVLLGYTGFDINGGDGSGSTDSLCGTGTIPNRKYNTTLSTKYCFLIYVLGM